MAAVVIAATAVAYVASGSPVPRPRYLFGGVAAALGALLFAVLRAETFSRSDILAIGGLATLAGGVLRFSAFITVITSGIDHTRWVRRVQSNIAANGITGTDMYASAPFYLLELGMGQQLFGLSAFETRFITLTIASLLPVVLGTFAYYLTDDPRTGLVAVLVATPQFLFLRTSALLEAESLALLWYMVTMLLVVRYLQTKDMRLFGLFTGFLLTSVFLHFLYAVILFCTIVGTLGLLVVVERTTPLDTPVSQETTYRLAQGTGAAGLFIPVWILMSTYGGVALDVIRSFFSRDTNEETATPTTETPGGTPETPGGTPETPGGTPETPGGTPETPGGTPETPGGTPEMSPDSAVGTTSPKSTAGQQVIQEPGDGGSSPLDMVLDFLLPQSGTVARSVGTAGSSGETLLALFPVVLFIGGGGLGSLVSTVRHRAYDLFLLVTLSTVTIMSVVSVFIDIEFQLGYRLYYFVGALLVVSMAIGIRRSSVTSRSIFVMIILVSIFLPYAALGPMTPLGNNVDPEFGGTDWRFSENEFNQLRSLDERFAQGGLVKYDVSQIPTHIEIRTSTTRSQLTKHNCAPDSGQIADTGDFSLCIESPG
ncbi:hypothetical protein [Haloarcula laminariae]|uniref:hypothetical protein n=1 Tax=Haloarcula laminariae TaxID=2961577 RepID=UPI0024062C03|nr:hypothetical protein [Halomicroarcula sp. FL173]